MKKAIKNSDSMVINDIYGKIMYHNEYTDAYSKFKSEDMLGKHIFEVYDWLNDDNCGGTKVIKTGEPVLNQIQIINPDSENPTQCILNCFPLKNSKGVLVGSINVSTIIDTSTENDKQYTRKSTSNSLHSKYTFNDIITEDIRMRNLISKLKKASNKDSNILLSGETGTGKELFAHSIHEYSNRSNYPFIAQNCAAIPSSAMEAILFGTKKGTFTGVSENKGILELADNGTLFLDEINSMPVDLQAKLLRFLEDGKIRKLGDSKEISVDVRIIASTNESQKKLLEGNSFRKDLFYRISGITADILPLRERKPDISILCNHFIEYHNNLYGSEITSIDSDALVLLTKYDWPGNIRELKNCIEQAFNNSNSDIIQTKDLPLNIVNYKNHTETITERECHDEMTLKDNLDRIEKRIIQDMLYKNNYRISKTAKALDITRQSLYNKIKKHGIDAGI